jgi:hypothetical protein
VTNYLGQAIPLALFILLLAVAGFSQTTPSLAEYRVYGAVLRSIYKENRRDYSNKSHFVIVDQTLKSEAASTPTSRKFRNLVKRFEVLNESRLRLEKKLPTGEYSNQYYLISQGMLDELSLIGTEESDRQTAEAKSKNKPLVIDFCGSVRWRPFYKKYPEANGYYFLSRAAISGGYTLVRVKREDVCSAFDMTYLLLKTKRGWQIVWTAGSMSVA